MKVGEPDPPRRPLGALARIPMLSSLGVRDFRFLWIGMTVSLVGDGVFLVALAWQVYELSNLPTALSIVGVAITLPQVVMLVLGGVISDRFDRRVVMVAADAVRGAAIGAIGALSLTGTLELWELCMFGGAYGAATAFFGPAFDAVVPEIVDAEALAGANSLDQLVRPAALRIAGPALGGLLIVVCDVGVAFLVDAATYVVSIVAVLLMTPRPRADAVAGGASVLGDIKEGFAYVRSKVWLWATFLAATVAYLLFFGPVEVLVPFVVKNEMHESANVLGVVFAMGGLGAVGGAMIVGQRGIPRRYITSMYIAWAVATFAVAGYGLATLPWQAMAASFVFNAFETAGTVVWATTKHRLVPLRLQGRVSSLDWFISIGLLPLSFALTGPVAAAVGARQTLVWAGVLGGVVTLAALFVPGMRATEREHPLAPRTHEVQAEIDGPSAPLSVRDVDPERLTPAAEGR
jgi:MFS family permease